MSNSMRPIPMLVEYGGEGNPVIAAEFKHTWQRQGWDKRVSYAWLRKLRADGVTHVALRFGAREADFSVTELLRSGRQA
jgi:hypothetical protein